MISSLESVCDFVDFDNTKAINDFLKKQNRSHAHLDWRSPVEWLRKSPSRIIHEEGEVIGVLSLPSDSPHLHWVRFFSTLKNSDYKSIWNQLFNSILENYPFSSSDLLSALCYQNWMETLLKTTGWEAAQKVIVLLWQGSLPPKEIKKKDLNIRRMKLNDLSTVVHIDDLSFASCWKFSTSTITLAFEQSAYSTIAELEGKIVGFQISNADLYRAHLTRLAVLPEYRNQGIGASLVSDMLRHFSVPWIRQITVNTQYDNQSSIHLYQRVGFNYLGESFPILQYPKHS